jgi:hypothetical protein
VDDVVPLSQSERLAERDPSAALVAVAGADHFDVVDPEHPSWASAAEWLSGRLQASPPG